MLGPVQRRIQWTDAFVDKEYWNETANGFKTGLGGFKLSYMSVDKNSLHCY